MAEVIDTAPSTSLLKMIGGNRITQVLYVTVKLGIPDLLRDGPRTSDDLAMATSAHPPSLYRLLRAAAGLGVLTEDREGCFHLTVLGDCLRSDLPASLRPMVLLFGEPFWWQVMGDLLYSVRTGRAAIPHLYGMGLWEYLECHPEDAAVFNDVMTTQTERHVPAILEAYDFSESISLVDIGGGHGALLTAILVAYQRIRGILFDRPSVLTGARRHFEESGIAERITLVEGDMFTALPDGADAYVAKLILHDWDDERAVQILVNIRHAMPEWGKLLLFEHVIQPGNEPQFAKLLDLSILAQLGGRERTAAEWTNLLRSAGMHVTRIIPTQAQISVIEAGKS